METKNKRKHCQTRLAETGGHDYHPDEGRGPASHGDGIGGNVFRGQVNHSGKPEGPVIQGLIVRKKTGHLCQTA